MKSRAIVRCGLTGPTLARYQTVGSTGGQRAEGPGGSGGAQLCGHSVPRSVTWKGGQLERCPLGQPLITCSFFTMSMCDFFMGKTLSRNQRQAHTRLPNPVPRNPFLHGGDRRMAFQGLLLPLLADRGHSQVVQAGLGSALQELVEFTPPSTLAAGFLGNLEGSW